VAHSETDFDQQLDQTGTLAEEDGPLLDQSFLSKIGRLDIVSRKILQGKIKGEKRSKKRGQSVEFADHRQYAPGDDLRFLDWSIYARLDRLMIKLFQEEEDLRIYVLVDSSASMDYGRPNKFRYVQKVAAALGYIGLVNQNRVGLGTFSSQLDRVFRPERGRRNLPKMISFLENTPCEGRTNLGVACKRFAQEHRQKGVVILISDFLDRHGYEDAVRFFTARKMDVFCLQVLSPQELDPPLAGDLKLIDAEDGEETEVTISQPLLDAYKKNLAALIGGLREFCHKRGARYLSASTAMPFDRLILDQLRIYGVVR
jgi:uncharacterized protein (DUF58 family)